MICYSEFSNEIKKWPYTLHNTFPNTWLRAPLESCSEFELRFCNFAISHIFWRLHSQRNVRCCSALSQTGTWNINANFRWFFQNLNCRLPFENSLLVFSTSAHQNVFNLQSDILSPVSDEVHVICKLAWRQFFLIMRTKKQESTLFAIRRQQWTNKSNLRGVSYDVRQHPKACHDKEERRSIFDFSSVGHRPRNEKLVNKFSFDNSASKMNKIEFDLPTWIRASIEINPHTSFFFRRFFKFYTKAQKLIMWPILDGRSSSEAR